jgi:hypothetical protein
MLALTGDPIGNVTVRGSTFAYRGALPGIVVRATIQDMTHLTHGWEPDLDASDSLLRRFVLATADRGEAIARAIGGRSHRTEVYSAADPASPVMFDNAIVVLQPPSYVDRAPLSGGLS